MRVPGDLGERYISIKREINKWVDDNLPKGTKVVWKRGKYAGRTAEIRKHYLGIGNGIMIHNVSINLE